MKTKTLEASDRPYRGCDNPNNNHGTKKKHQLTSSQLMLVPMSSLPAEQRKARGGVSSARRRVNQWVPA